MPAITSDACWFRAVGCHRSDAALDFVYYLYIYCEKDEKKLNSISTEEYLKNIYRLNNSVNNQVKAQNKKSNKKEKKKTQNIKANKNCNIEPNKSANNEEIIIAD